MGVTRKFALATAIIVASTTGALATDLYVPPAEEPIFADDDNDWSGFYVGKFGIITNATLDPPGLEFESLYGVGKVLGVNFDTGAIVFGVEGIVAYYWPQFDDTFQLDVGNQILIEGAGRVGIDLGDQVLIYALAGIGTIHRISGPGPTPLNFWTVGGGVEFLVDENWSLRGQYNRRIFTNFDGLTSDNFSFGVSYLFD